MTGKILPQTAKNPNFCFIQGEDGKTYFAHRDDFPDKSIMREGQEVEYRPKLAAIPGKPHPVTDVVALTPSAP